MEGAEIRPKNIARQNLSDAEKIATSKDSLSSRIKTAREISATSKLKKSEEYSEDLEERIEKEIQKVTDEIILEIDNLTKEKTNDIMSL